MTPEANPAGLEPAASAPASPPAPAQPSKEQIPSPAPSAAAPAQQDQPEPGTPAAETDAGQGEQEQPKPKSRFQERIDQLTAQKREAEARAAAAEARLRSLRQLPDIPTDRELTYEEQDALRVRQAVRQERAEETALEAAQNVRQIAQARLQMFEAKVEAVADRMPDLREKFAAVPVSDFAADFIAESERAADIAYFLGSNPHEAVRIARLPDTRQAVELARLEARLSAAPTVRKTTTAPNPPPTVGGGVSPGPKDPSTMSMSEYAEWYRKRAKGA